MKLSERLSRYIKAGDAITQGGIDAIAALEADLADANARAMELTARCDRMRVERDVARAVMRNEPDVQERWEAMLYAEFCAQEDAAKARAGIVILHLVYEMREHAREQKARRIFDQCENMRSVGLRQGRAVSGLQASRLHRRAQAAESRAIKAEREAATLRVRLQGAIAKIPPGDLWRQPDPVVTATCPVHETVSGFCSFDCPDRIPAAALEASDGGARRMDAAEGWCWRIGGPVTRARDDGRCPECGGDFSQHVEDLARRRVTERAESVSHDEAHSIAQRFIDEHFGNKNERPRASIPADVTRDDDIRLVAYIDQQRAAIAERDARIAALERERDALKWSDAHVRDCAVRLTEENDQLRADRDEAIARAARAEAVIAKVRVALLTHETFHYRCSEALSVLDGKEGV